MEENLDAYSFVLTDEELTKIDEVRSDPAARKFVAYGFERQD